MNDEWKTIAGFEAYAVSSLGRVKRVVGGRGARAGKILTWHTCTQTGYADVRLVVNGKAHARTVHTLVARAFLGSLPDGLVTRHLDGDKLNCRLTNLAYGTLTDNAQDKVAHGRSSYGEKNPCAKITQAIADSIRFHHKSGVSAKELAASHGLCESTVHRIVSGKYWGRSQEASNRAEARATA